MQESMIERICRLIEEKHIKDKDFCSAIQISQSTFSTWKKLKRDPKAAYIKPISKFLGVSESYLLAGENNILGGEENGYYLDEESARIAQEIYDNPELKMLFDATRKVSANDLRLVAEMVKRMTVNTGDD